MKLTKKVIEAAEEAYAQFREPWRWDGVPWGEAGRTNHRLAIENAIKAAFATMEKPPKPKPRQNQETRLSAEQLDALKEWVCAKIQAESTETRESSDGGLVESIQESKAREKLDSVLLADPTP